MKILIICETIDFQNFTRRFTFEAIARKNKNTIALCHTHISNYYKTNLISQFISIKCFYGIIPISIKEGFLRKFEYVLNLYWQNFIKTFDVIIISSPNQYYFLDYIKSKQKVLFLISDPYCIMGHSKEKELEILKRADLIVATSKNLTQHYIKKYYKLEFENKTIYWPNSVDTHLWNINNFKNEKKSTAVTIGFAGNFMEIVDLPLLEKIIKEFPEHIFILAGKITSITLKDRMENIFSLPNVIYKGFIPYNNLPAEVMKWDVCIMIDNIDELSSYHHHNKFYQYLALGKPIVLQQNHSDYDKFNELVYIAKNHDNYIKNLRLAVLEKNNSDNKLIEKRIEAANENNVDIRASYLLKEIKKNYEV